MYVNAVLSPALGASTVVEHSCDAIRFVASLEISEHARRDWIVELWYHEACDDAQWKSAAFTPASEELTVYDASEQLGREKRIYTLSLPCSGSTGPIKFTLRFKNDARSAWIWSRDINHTDDGQILFRQPECASQVPFETLFTDLNSEISVKPVRSRTGGIDIYDVSSPTASNNEWNSTTIGTPVSLEHYYALVKIRSPWMGPRQGAGKFDIDSDALIVGYLRTDGRHVVVLAISGLGTTTFIRSDAGKVQLKSRNDSGKAQSQHALVATGLDWQVTVSAAFAAARDLLAHSGITEETAPPDLEAYWRESWYDGLGYCTWNSLGRELTADRVLDALQDLHDKGIKISTVIIDDNWQTLDSENRWDRFEANKNFPRGLIGLTSEIKIRFKNIQHIAVWHAKIGYWGGISPTGWIAAQYKTTTIKWHGGDDVMVVDEKDVNRLYSDFYRFLSNNGIDSIKCDVQSSLHEFDNAIDRKRLGHAYQDAFRINSLRYFSGRVIYCMAEDPDIFFHSLLKKNGPTVLLRNSDDFYPDIPDSHLWHLFANAMNNIFTSQLNVFPDWDMFQTSLPIYAGVHAAGRCISGGPIYITDSPGSHSLPIINHMVATSVRDHTRAVVLRPSTVSLPLDPFVSYKGPRLLKLATVFEASSMIAVFNVSSSETSEFISLPEFKGLDRAADKKYVIRQQSTGRVFGPATKASDATVISLTLPVAGWEFLSAVPVHQAEGFDVGVLGLVGQFSGAAAVLAWAAVKDGAVTMVTVRIKALGVLGFYISDLASREIDDMFITILGRPIPVRTVTKSTKDPAVLEVDVEGAWKELGLGATWSNEVLVKLFI